MWDLLAVSTEVASAQFTGSSLLRARSILISGLPMGQADAQSSYYRPWVWVFLPFGRGAEGSAFSSFSASNGGSIVVLYTSYLTTLSFSFSAAFMGMNVDATTGVTVATVAVADSVVMGPFLIFLLGVVVFSWFFGCVSPVSFELRVPSCELRAMCSFLYRYRQQDHITVHVSGKDKLRAMLDGIYSGPPLPLKERATHNKKVY